MAGFLGIDLTSVEAKPSACVGLDKELNLIYFGFPRQDSDILRVVSRCSFELVAIDAPLSLPDGLCCLEESCSCQPKVEVKGRSCEWELARLGIPCYFTTQKSIIKAVVYSYASKVCLFGKFIPAKSRTAGLAFLKRCISGLLPNISAYVDGFNHHLCDVAIAAYTASLHWQGKKAANW